MGATTRTEAGQLARSGQVRYHDREVETMPRDRLRVLQLERLRATVDNAYRNVPLHRARMDAAGVKPSDIRTLEHVARLPFTVKTDPALKLSNTSKPRF